VTTTLADALEERCGIPALLKDLGPHVEAKRLPAGDYLVAEGTLVERKAESAC
jgi:ERCC4-type nuclease